MHSSSGFSSDDVYTLTAVPHLHPETDSSSRLKSVLFIATDGYNTTRWVAANMASFVADSAFLVDAGTAHRIFQRLRNGETVTFPGVFSL